MADWSKPTITSNYVTFVDEVKARDVDAITLQWAAITNPPVAAVKFVRTGANENKFQHWGGVSWIDLPISVTGGGTGGVTAAQARTNLGLGTIATQNANAISITGGNISNTGLNGSMALNGVLYIYGSGIDHALTIYGAANGWGIHCVPTTGHGGILIQGSQNQATTMLQVRASDTGRDGLKVRGDMTVLFPHRLVIPVGADAWATP